MFIKKKEYKRLIKQLEKVENLYFKQIDAIVQKGIEIAELKKKNEDLKIRLNSVWDAHEKLISPEYEKEIERRIATKIFEEFETVIYSVTYPCVNVDGTITTKHVEGLHFRIEDYNAIKEKYTGEPKQ